MNYIVLDLEWNQHSGDTDESMEGLPFEIIEIGAIKLNEERKIISEFSELVKPQIYHEMHRITSKLIHLQMKELQRGRPFCEVATQFFDWCGEDYTFCTWGSLDLIELQRNMAFYDMTPLSDKPIPYLDVQKLFGIAYDERKQKRALEYAVDFMELEKDIPFHRAFSDAYYTAKVFAKICEMGDAILKNLSFDVYHAPKRREDEIKIQFDSYMKYISRTFRDKIELFADKEVSSSKCYLCHRNLRKKVRWFTPNGRHYYCVAYCETHGFLKGKIRVRKTEDNQLFAVKTTKFVSKEEATQLEERKEHAAQLKKKHKK